MSDDFVHLHTHTMDSGFDGFGTPEEFVRLAAERGQPALSLTEHGTGRSIYDAAKAARSHSIKHIVGCEFYLTDDASLRGLTKADKELIKKRISDPDEAKAALKSAERDRRDRDHITIWALDQEGLRNFYRLMHYSWNKGFYYKPRIDLSVIRRFSKGLAASTGCPGGVVTSPVRSNNLRAAMKRMRELKDIFGDRLYVEIMPHVPEESCVHLPRKMEMIARRFDCQVLATQDAHYPKACDHVHQDGLLCIHTRSKLSDPDRFKFDTTHYWMKTRTEYEAHVDEQEGATGVKLSRWKGYIDNTLAFAERVTAEVESVEQGRYLAAPTLPEKFDSYYKWLLDLCIKGMRQRGIDPRSAPSYKNRLLYELRVIRDFGFSAYFCLNWDIRDWARNRAGLICGPGRGSGGGSLVCYVLGITDLDPIEHDLSFDRFLAPGRTDLPDIDLDFASHQRQDCIEYLRSTYGDAHVAHISTHIHLGGRSVLRDLGRICSVPPSAIEPIASMIHTAQSEDEKDAESLATVLRGTKLGQEFSTQYPDVAEMAAALEGQFRTTGLHAGGIVVSSVPIEDHIPVESSRKDGGEYVPMTAYDMHGVEASGFVKVDILGLKTLKVCALAFEDAGREPGEIDLEDPEVLAAFSRQEFAGVFQFDTPSARRVCAGMEFKRFSDIPAMTALNRPGPLKTGLVEQFLARHRGDEATPPIHPIYDKIHQETYGVPVYQEQVIALARKLAGFSAEEADKFRKAIAKKIGLEKYRIDFVDGAEKAGMPLAEAEKLFSELEGFAQYAFNKSHSYTYSALSLWTMWLKVHEPLSFYSASLEVRRGDTVKQLRLCAEARARGLLIEPPDVNTPTPDGFAVDRSGPTARILGSISDIKGVGPKAASAIAANAPYSSIEDFKERTGRSVTLAHFKALASASAFRSVVPTRRLLAEHPSEVWKGQPTPPTPEYGSEDEEALVVGGVWPIYRSLTGASSFDANLRAVRKEVGNVFVPGDDEVFEPGGRLVLALPSTLNLYTDKESGKRAGRAIVVSGEGEELVLRVDTDLVRFASLLEGDAPVLLYAYLTEVGRRHSLEMAWPIDQLDDLAKLLGAPKASALRDDIEALDAGDVLSVSRPTLVRKRLHKDKKRNQMATLGVLASGHYFRILVFSRRFASRDATGWEPGTEAKMIEIEKLDRGGICLGRRKILAKKT